MATHGDWQAKGVIMAGAPIANAAVYHRVRFAVLDTVVYLEVPVPGERVQRVLILRDIEVERARRQARVDVVYCPSDLVPREKLSGDREIANAQAAAECLRRHGVQRVVATGRCRWCMWTCCPAQDWPWSAILTWEWPNDAPKMPRRLPTSARPSGLRRK